MTRRLIFRVLSIFITLIFTSLVVFILIDKAPGSSTAVLFAEEAKVSAIVKYQNTQSLSDTFIFRYFFFLKSFFTFNWGNTIAGRPIVDVIKSRLPVTISLTILTTIFALIISFPLSLAAARRKGCGADKLLSFLSVLALSVPSFIIALILVLIFAMFLKWFPIAGYTSLKDGFFNHIKTLFLPALTAAIMQSSLYLRLFVATLRENLDADYTRTALAWGMREKEIVRKVALKPSLPVILSLIAQSIASSITGSAVLESVFALPGIGSLLLSAALSRDAILSGVTLLLLVLLVSIVFIISEFLGYLSDPRLRSSYEEN